ncbi:hypothetical protein [Halomonas sp. C05BenzN]|uniref:hypothetical protein n=1 Tax=Halomonas sp. C05BenzN TaxID=3411041 RepID=UPI003B923E87
MLPTSSRYQASRPFEPRDAPGTFPGHRARPVPTAEGMLEHRVDESDRLDRLALHYYNDDRLWWRILDANPELLSADELSGPDWIGRVLLIPTRSD